MSFQITPEYLAKSGTEDGEQAALFCHAGLVAQVGANSDDWQWSLLYAIPNGGQRTLATAARLKATGVKAGFPDIGLPVACAGYHGLFIELKRARTVGKRGTPIGGGSVQTKQDEWHTKLRNEGYRVAVCHGWLEAADCIANYLELK